MNTSSEPEHRILRLENSNRRTRRIIIAGFSVLGLSFLLGSKPARVVTAEKFVLQHNGKRMAELKMEGGNPYFTIYTHSGQVGLSMTVLDQGAFMKVGFRKGPGVLVSNVTNGDMSGAKIDLFDQRGVATVSVSDRPKLIMRNRKAENLVTLPKL